MLAWINGRQVGYDDVGSGDPIVFLHGFPHRRSLWAPQLGALLDRARCIAPDLRGFGESEAREPYSMDQYAYDVVELMDHLRIERAVVCGLSMGGYVAFALWRNYAPRIRGLVLMDTRPGADNADSVQKRRDMIAMARERGSAAVADAMITGMVGKSTREKCPEIVDAVHSMLESAPVSGVIGALEAMIGRIDSTPTLATIDVPTLIVVGEEDALTPPKESEVMRQAIAESRMEVISGAGHVSNLERSATVNHVLSEFLASLSLS
ncbi:MAG: alpha/beta fold hydrolase [Gemmatimonadaceae bacterium]